jgi:ParB family transcriptional regulator, chromosome partitioning protein
MPQANIMPLIEKRPLDWFKPDERELARHNDPEKIRLLGLDMLANGQLQAVGAREDQQMVFGHGRWLAAKSTNIIEMLETKIYPASLSDTQFKLIRAAENLQRKDLTGYQKWLLCADLMRINPGWLMKDLAAHMNLKPSSITRLLSPSNTIVAVQKALEEGKIGISDCYAISKLPENEQAAMLETKFAGASRDSMEAAGRKTRETRSGEKTAVKAAKVKCPLPNGVTVVVSGNGVSLDESIEALGEAIKEMKRARDLGYTAKTFSAAMRDKAKARV